MAVRCLFCTCILVGLATGVNAAAILLSLLKELQKESQAVKQLASISAQWCSDAEHQSVGMAQVIQGQLDDASVAVQQIRSDETRLQSEVTLARSTQQQREQQLQDAIATSKFAVAEFASEQDQLNKTIGAAEHAMRLVKAQMQMDAQQQQQLGSADAAVSNLLQTAGDHISDDEKDIMSELVSDPKPTQSPGERPQQLLQTLSSLHERLQREQATANSEHQVMSARLWSFTDHLNSSIMESKSQAASISMEMAQRKRERTRLDGKIAMLNTVQSKVQDNVRATKAACSANNEHKTAVQKFIEEESDSVRTTLKQMPQLSSELLFDLSNVLPTAPTFSFMQLRGGRRQQAKVHDPISPILMDLEAMERKFPDDSSAFAAAQKLVGSHRSTPDAQDSQLADQKPQDGISGFASSSIQDIYAFLKSDEQGGGVKLPGEERMLLGNSGDLKKVTGVYGKLLDGVQSKEKAVDDQLKWCSSIARDAKVDSDAVARSLKWTGAKLNLVQVAMSEYEAAVTFNKQQQISLDTSAVKLQKLAEVEDGQLQQTYQTLKEYGQQLLSLATELSQKSSAEERKGAEIVRSLLDRLERHQGLIQTWRVESKDKRQAVEATAKVVQQSLADNIKQANRRLVRLKVESQALTSLSSSKAKDKQLSERYVSLSQELCSGSRAKDLQAKEHVFQQEAAAIEKSLSALALPSAA